MSALAAKACEHAIGGRSDRRRLAEKLGPQTHGGDDLAGDRRRASFGEERCEVARERGVVEGFLADGRVEAFERAGVRPTRVGAQARRGQCAGGVGELGERAAAVADDGQVVHGSVLRETSVTSDKDNYRQ